MKNGDANSVLGSCNLPLSKQSEFQQVELIYEAEIDGMGRGGELDSKNTNALDLLCRRSRAS
jgi:hypothetical protein